MTRLRLLTTDDKIAEIRRLYFETTKETIKADFTKALDLLKSISSEDERDRAAVFIDGMVQMQAEWGQSGKKRKHKTKKG